MAYYPVTIEPAHKAGNAAFKIVSPLGILAFVPQGYFQPLIEVGHLPQALTYRIEIIADFAENLFISQEGDDGAGALGVADGFYRPLGHTLLVFLLVKFAVTLHF